MKNTKTSVSSKTFDYSVQIQKWVSTVPFGVSKHCTNKLIKVLKKLSQEIYNKNGIIPKDVKISKNETHGQHLKKLEYSDCFTFNIYFDYTNKNFNISYTN